MPTPTQEKSAVALLSVVSNGTLVLLKLGVGLAISSVSVVSEAIHSGVDLAASLIALYAVRTSGSPADEEHPFGHGKVENISGVIEALLIFVAAGWIIWEAVNKLIQGSALESVGWGILVMLVSTVTNIVVSRRLLRVGQRTGSAALIADAWHLRTDVYTSAGVMIGLALVGVGKGLLPGVNLHWFDPVAAIIVAALIIRAAYDLTRESGRDLLDARLPMAEEAVIREVIASFSPQVLGSHRLRTRRSGVTRFVEFHIQVDGRWTVEAAHSLSHQIGAALRDKLPGTTVNIHIEPHRPDPGKKDQIIGKIGPDAA
jgi:cation diffusion facilitator family transporter